MLYHLSFNAREPERVAGALAEILDAKVVNARHRCSTKGPSSCAVEMSEAR